MLKFYQRLCFLGTIVLFCCFLVLMGCSRYTTPNHLSPYYGLTVSESQKGDIELPAPIRYRLILIGDGGAPAKDEPVLKTLGEWAAEVPRKTSIVFLGDNMYPEGLTEKDRNAAAERLDPQLAVVTENQTCGLFIPGNHDWKDGGKRGLSTVMAQEDYINKRLGAQPECEHPVFLPGCGKPGPRMLELPPAAPTVRLVVLDTQWWLHKYQKPHKDPKAVIEELKTQLMTELPVVVVGHHPIETHGRHGGFGSFGHYLKWRLRLSGQDTSATNYKDMVNRLNEAFSVPRKTPLLIYAAGHDHSLQVLKGRNADYLLVSGAGSREKISGVTNGDNTEFAYAHTGFMVIDFLEDNTALLRVVDPVKKGARFNLIL